MNNKDNHIFTSQEAAVAYSMSAERIFNAEYDFLNNNPAIIPILVSLLFQSLEISIKHACIEAELFSETEARSRKMRNGHGIKELAKFAVKRLGGTTYSPIVTAMTHFNENKKSGKIISTMICGEEFEETRNCYASRNLGYGQVVDGGFALTNDISAWIDSVKQTATNLPKTINVLKQWKSSNSNSKCFAIWEN